LSQVCVIGSGISGLSAACYAAKAGHKVTVFEKNDTLGGRARQFSEDGYVFDMGPSWYWMPDVFDSFFADFGKSTADYYKLIQLDPGFRIFFEGNDLLDVPASMPQLYDVFEQIEPGSGALLKSFLADAAYKYREGMLKLAGRPSVSWLEFADISLLLSAAKLKMFTSMRSHVREYFKDKRLVALMEFPVIFLGAMPADIPALYSLMNYAALEQGTWYPQGGMYNIVDAMHQLAVSLGVQFYTGASVKKIEVAGHKAHAITTDKGTYMADAVIATGDYHHVEQDLLATEFRNYNEHYWDKKTFAPSCLIFYVGVNKKIDGLQHHNLFFDTDFDQHSREIYKDPAWPEAPLFYVCCPSKTDDSVAPAGHENLFILMPVAVDLKDDDQKKEHYFKSLIARIENKCGVQFSADIVYKRVYSVEDFKSDYNAYKGNAYGLANTLRQTAVLKPKIVNRKVNNLFYAGQLTVPGPGVPPSIMSGKIAAGLAIKQLNRK
jgi:phytoene desaturase